mgnify:CR=1 FL=1
MATEEQEWQSCPSGELSKMVEAKRARHRRKRIDRFAVVAAGVMAFIAIGGFSLGLFTPDGGNGTRAMACSEVVPQLSAYVQGDLDESIRNDIAAHLNYCPSCRTHHQELLKSVSKATIPGYPFIVAAL